MSDLFNPHLIAGNAKAVMKVHNAPSSDLWKVAPEDLCFIDGFNVRSETADYLAHIESITASIMANGFMSDKPLAAFVADDGKIYITDGHSRLRAARLAIERGYTLEQLPVVVKPRGTSMEDITIALVTSNSGKALTPFETGVVIKRLIGMGLDEKEIAKRLALGLPYVKDLLNLVAAPKPIRDMVIEGKVSATTAIVELEKHGGKAVKRLEDAHKVAVASGKTKVTAKHLKPAKAKKPPTKTVWDDKKQAEIVPTVVKAMITMVDGNKVHLTLMDGGTFNVGDVVGVQLQVASTL